MKRAILGLYVAVTVALMVWGYYQAIYVAPNDAMQGEIFRIIYYHVPSFAAAFCFFAVSLAGSIGFLAFRHSHPDRAQIADALALAGAEVGVVFCTVGLTTGPLWARRAWGMWWTWDALARRCKHSPQFWASLVRWMCRLSIWRTAGGERSIRLLFSAARETLEWTPRWWARSYGTFWRGWLGD
jgi:ABC-type transport system involved in cytochrome c biogenesis permease subunit